MVKRIYGRDIEWKKRLLRKRRDGEYEQALRTGSVGSLLMKRAIEDALVQMETSQGPKHSAPRTKG